MGIGRWPFEQAIARRGYPSFRSFGPDWARTSHVGHARGTYNHDPRKGFTELLESPVRRRMSGHMGMNQASGLDLKSNEYIKDKEYGGLL